MATTTRNMTRDQLYREAKRLGIKGRSKMNKGVSRQPSSAAEARSSAERRGGPVLSPPRLSFLTTTQV
jgi:hypothetical protein